MLALDHQIAQKLHACTTINARTGGTERAAELADLQILEQDEHIDYAALNATATPSLHGAVGRGRRRSSPTTAGTPSTPKPADGLDVIEHGDDAVAWVNHFIARTSR